MGQQCRNRSPKHEQGKTKNDVHAVPILQDGEWLRLDTSAGALPRKPSMPPNELGLYSGATNKPLKGFRGRGIRNEEDTVDMRNISLAVIL